MFRHKAETAVILGAGFSKCAEIPLQSEFTGLLLSDEFGDPTDKIITSAIKDFLEKVFNWRKDDPLPNLEDILTFIDLSSLTGHNLGRDYTPKMLRALRRMLIYRFFSIIDYRFSPSEDILKFLECYLPEEGDILTHFIVLNWDIVLERHLESTRRNPKVDYCCQTKPWAGDYGSEPPVGIAKVHGSSNWAYCDNCKALFYDRNRKLSLYIRAGLVKSDFEIFQGNLGDKLFEEVLGISERQRSCRACQSAVGPHIATFSYRKSFRTHAFASSWSAAETILDQAKNWLFVGYSLPDADYEFKHLLKTSQLKFANQKAKNKDITAVVYNDNLAETRFKTLFGSNQVQVVQTGLKGYVNQL